MTGEVATKEVVVAAAIMNCVRDKKQNLEKYKGFIEQAASNDTRLIVFPEMSLQGHVWDMLGTTTEDEYLYHYKNAEPIPGPSTEVIAEEAKRHNMSIVFGMAEKAAVGGEAVLYNSCVLVNPEGSIGIYRKVHAAGNEVRLFNKGACWPVFDTDIGRIGMLSCYDRIFPESTRELALQGADILVILSAWSAGADEPEPAYWGSLGRFVERVRALENQCWVISSNHTEFEKKGGVEYHGHSRIVSPSGEVIAEGGYEEGLVTARINIKKEIRRTRTGIFFGLNFLKDRMPETYTNIANRSIYLPPHQVSI